MRSMSGCMKITVINLDRDMELTIRENIFHLISKDPQEIGGFCFIQILSNFII